MPNNDLPFWVQLAIERWLAARAVPGTAPPERQKGSGSTPSPGMPPADEPPLPPEAWEMLWAFVEDRAEGESDSALGELLARHPMALAQLARMLRVEEEVSRQPPGDAHQVWQRLATASSGKVARRPVSTGAAAHDATAMPESGSPAASQAGWMRRMADLVVRLSQRGAELVSSSGRPAFAPAVARSGVMGQSDTVAQEFFVAAGTFRVVVQRGREEYATGPTSLADVVVSVTRLAPRWHADALEAELWDEQRQHCLRSEPMDAGGARLAGLPPGTYCLCVVEEQQSLAELQIVIAAEER